MDPNNDRHRLPVVKRTISFTSPRSAILLNPAVLIVMSILVAAAIFTIWPEALEHSPISFEKRGVVHHIWHYALLGGSVLALYGMFSASLRRLQFEFAGLVLLVTAVAMNFVAQVSRLMDQGAASAGEDGVTGFGLCLRVGVIATLALRAWVLVAEPVVQVPVTPPQTDSHEGGGS